ncbi:MAG: hypothetical protein V4735_03480 [Pseudomonadota bacterium]
MNEKFTSPTQADPGANLPFNIKQRSFLNQLETHLSEGVANLTPRQITPEEKEAFVSMSVAALAPVFEDPMPETRAALASRLTQSKARLPADTSERHTQLFQLLCQTIGWHASMARGGPEVLEPQVATATIAAPAPPPPAPPPPPKHAARFKKPSGRGKPQDEPPITAQQLNAVQQVNLYDMFVEELMARIPENDFRQMSPLLPALGATVAESIDTCFDNWTTPKDRYPATMSVLHERFEAGANALIPLLHDRGATLDAGEQIAFQATYRSMCRRLETTMTYGRDASPPSSQWVH